MQSRFGVATQLAEEVEDGYQDERKNKADESAVDGQVLNVVVHLEISTDLNLGGKSLDRHSSFFVDSGVINYNEFVVTIQLCKSSNFTVEGLHVQKPNHI